MKCNNPIRERVLDSIDRKIAQTESNGYERKGENEREKALSRLEGWKRAVLSRKTKRGTE